MTTGDLPPNITIGPKQWVRVNAAGTALEAALMASSYADLPDAPTAKRTETYSGTSDGSGNYTVTYSTAFGSTPDVQPQIQAGSSSDTRTVRITASSTTGFTVNVRNRTDVIGLLPSYANVRSAAGSVLVTER